MTTLKSTTDVNGTSVYVFGVDRTTETEVTYTLAQLNARKTKLESKIASAEEVLDKANAELTEVNALIALI